MCRKLSSISFYQLYHMGKGGGVGGTAAVPDATSVVSLFVMTKTACHSVP